MSRTPHALPEAFIPGEWTVKEGRPQTHLIKREMHLPAQEDCTCGLNHWRSHHLHEMMHVAVSPVDSDQYAATHAIPIDYLTWADEWIISALQAKILPDDLPICKSRMTRIVQAAKTLAGTRARIELFLDTCCNPHIWKKWKKVATEEEKAFHTISGSILLETTRGWRSYDPTAKAIASAIAKLFSDSDADSKPEAVMRGTIQSSVKSPKGIGVHQKWGTMTTESPQLVRSTTQKYGPSRFSSRPEGLIPRNMARFCSDGAVFRHRQHGTVGSLLIDGSGSMRFTQQDLQQILDNSPAATVGLYGGTGAFCGTLRILAKRGRQVAQYDVASPGSGNEVDGPALEWLARQPAPRIWLSDGQVCAGWGSVGPIETSSEEWLRADVDRICSAGRIRRIETFKEILAFLRQGRR